MSGHEDRLDALVADLDVAEVIDVIPDAMGDKVRVGGLRDAVLVGVQGSPGILDTPGLRDRFGRAYREACRRAAGGDPAGLLTESQRFQVQEARDCLGTWDLSRRADVIDRERVLADQVRALLAIIDAVVPASGEEDARNGQ